VRLRLASAQDPGPGDRHRRHLAHHAGAEQVEHCSNGHRGVTVPGLRLAPSVSRVYHPGRVRTVALTPLRLPGADREDRMQSTPMAAGTGARAGLGCSMTRRSEARHVVRPGPPDEGHSVPGSPSTRPTEPPESSDAPVRLMPAPGGRSDPSNVRALAGSADRSGRTDLVAAPDHPCSTTLRPWQSGLCGRRISW
jgi:hypothetical protein